MLPVSRCELRRFRIPFTTSRKAKLRQMLVVPSVDGYALVYSNSTLPGMSGGPVLDPEGQLIGIHGRADTATKVQDQNLNPDIYVKSGFNLGIPINTFTTLAPKAGIDVGV